MRLILAVIWLPSLYILLEAVNGDVLMFLFFGMLLTSIFGHLYYFAPKIEKFWDKYF